MTVVVNLWRENYDVYIGRIGHGQEGYFGNPHPLGRRCPLCARQHTREDCLDAYRVYFLARVADDPEFRARVLALQGTRLGCFCRPQRCHGDIIVAWLDEEEECRERDQFYNVSAALGRPLEEG